MPKRFGAFPSQMIQEVMDAGFISGVDPSLIGPSSLDLAVTDEAFRLPSVFLPKPGERVRSFILSCGTKHDPSGILERGLTYAFRLAGRVRLPEEVYGYVNPKSTIGRTDTHVRVVADGVSRYDHIPSGWEGEHWVLVTPKSFPVCMSPGVEVSQLRLFNSDQRLDRLGLELALERWQLLWSREGRPWRWSDLRITDYDDALILTLSLTDEPVGWVCHHSGEVFDFVKPAGFYDPELFFQPIEARNGRIHLEAGRFYVLATEEAVLVPPELACEMRPMDDRSGEFRAHYAGFIDPGYGWGIAGSGRGRTLTLEVRPFENMTIRAGQPIARIRFERMAQVPAVTYDERPTSSYVHPNGPRLAKQFRMPLSAVPEPVGAK